MAIICGFWVFQRGNFAADAVYAAGLFASFLLYLPEPDVCRSRGVIRKVSGQPWHEFIRQRIFQPLGMNHTYIPGSVTPMLAQPDVAPFLLRNTVVKIIDTLGFGGYDPAGAWFPVLTTLRGGCSSCRTAPG